MISRENKDKVNFPHVFSRRMQRNLWLVLSLVVLCASHVFSGLIVAFSSFFHKSSVLAPQNLRPFSSDAKTNFDFLFGTNHMRYNNLFAVSSAFFRTSTTAVAAAALSVIFSTLIAVFGTFVWPAFGNVCDEIAHLFRCLPVTVSLTFFGCLLRANNFFLICLSIVLSSWHVSFISLREFFLRMHATDFIRRNLILNVPLYRVLWSDLRPHLPRPIFFTFFQVYHSAFAMETILSAAGVIRDYKYSMVGMFKTGELILSLISPMNENTSVSIIMAMGCFVVYSAAMAYIFDEVSNVFETIQEST